ncbi:MAG: ATP-grasp domain-containing protein [Gammaproteobacteria bacterium]
MRLLVTEFITGGGFANHPLPDGLKQEGLLMLNAVLADCSRMSDIHLTTCLDPRIELTDINVDVYPVVKSVDYMQQVSKLAHENDYAWVIAPESAGVLESLISRLTKENIPTINCDASSIRIAGDKIKCALQLLEAGIDTAVNFSLAEAQQYTNKTVIKSRFGVGCEGLKVCDSGVLALECIDDFNQWVVQAYIEGEHLSLSLLCYSGEARILSCNKQVFSGNEEPKLKSCHVNEISINEKMEILANNIAKTFPGFAGYVGVDLIKRGSDYVVIDINPRLTSSYVGLNEVLISNPAELCIKTILNQKLPENIMRNSETVEVCLD